MKLYQYARLIRGKNAGPYVMTIDILFETQENYQHVIGSGILTNALIAELYEVPVEQVERYESPLAQALKFSFPRKVPVGDFWEMDLFGGQMHAPLVNIEIPD